MALGGGAGAGAGAEPPIPGPWGGKGLDGEGAPTWGGLAGTAGLGFTSGGTMSDMSIGERRKNNCYLTGCLDAEDYV